MNQRQFAGLPLWRVAIATCFFASIGCAATARAEEKMLLFIGTVPDAKSAGAQGIYSTTLDPNTGELAQPTLVGKAMRPSFIELHPNGRFLYACNEIGDFEGKKSGGVTAFSIVDEKTGKLEPLNDQPSGGRGPCYVRLDAMGRNLLVANYGSGSVAVLPVDEQTGKLAPASAVVQHEGKSVNPKRQEGPHAHSFNVSPDNRFALACDLGLDKILVYRFDATAGKLAPADPAFATVPPGVGPRHLAFSKDGKFVYVGNEMGNTITAFSYDAESGAMKQIQNISTLPEGYSETSYVSETAMHPSGKFLYVANRGHDSIAGFGVDEATGKLTPIGHTPTGGKWPRHFKIDPTGRWMLIANQNSGDVTTLGINTATGALSPAGAAIKLSQPMCIQFYAPDR